MATKQPRVFAHPDATAVELPDGTILTGPFDDPGDVTDDTNPSSEDETASAASDEGEEEDEEEVIPLF
jgi:hypothetical protein